MVTQGNTEFSSQTFVVNKIRKKFLQKDDVDDDNVMLMMMMMITTIIRAAGLVCFDTLLSYTFRFPEYDVNNIR